MDLSAKIILVTGGGSGIGLELTRQLIALGNTVVICGRNAEQLEAAAQRTGALAVAGDVTRAEDQERILATIAERHGRLDLLRGAAVLEQLRADVAAQEEKTEAKIKKILVISLTNIGDVVLTFPVIDILKKDFPASNISVVIGPKAQTLLMGNPYLDKIYILC